MTLSLYGSQWVLVGPADQAVSWASVPSALEAACGVSVSEAKAVLESVARLVLIGRGASSRGGDQGMTG